MNVIDQVYLESVKSVLVIEFGLSVVTIIFILILIDSLTIIPGH